MKVRRLEVSRRGVADFDHFDFASSFLLSAFAVVETMLTLAEHLTLTSGDESSYGLLDN